MDTAPPSAWSPLCALADLPVGRSRLFKTPRLPVALFHTEGGHLFASDNRCPHEGYPLTQGDVSGCVLTCKWHNFKFNLEDGACLVGEEDLRVLPVRVVDGWVEVDLREPAPQAAIDRAKKSLDLGLFENELGRVARDTARLLDLGVSPEALLLHAARWDADHAEWGTTHALPVAADLLDWLPRRPGLDATAVILPAMELAARGSVRRLPRPRPAPLPVDADPERVFAALRSAVEAERAAEAEGIFFGAWGAGIGWSVVRDWLLRLAADHFLDFGHELIFVEKLNRLARAAASLPEGREALGALTGTLIYRFVYATREEQLPPWIGWSRKVAALDLPALGASLARGEGPAAVGLVDALLAEDQTTVIDALRGAIDAGTAPQRLIDALVEAAARRLLRFDPAWDLDPTVQDSWLSVSHPLTHAHALRTALPRLSGEEGLRLLFFAARFIHAAHPLDGAGPADEAATSAVSASLADLHAAIRHREPARAVVVGEAMLHAGLDLEGSLQDYLLAAPATEPIFVAHQIKTTVVALAERRLTGSATPLLAVLRWFASPMVERRLAQRAHEAVLLIREGRPPRVLGP